MQEVWYQGLPTNARLLDAGDEREWECWDVCKYSSMRVPQLDIYHQVIIFHDKKQKRIGLLGIRVTSSKDREKQKYDVLVKKLSI